MKKIITLTLTLLCLGSFAQTQQNINKNNGTVSNPINQIDSIRFNSITNQMEVVLQNGLETHTLTDVLNVNFTLTSNPCFGITSLTDIDGNEYQVVAIGNQCWTRENLKTSKFADGSAISNITNDATWSNLSTPAWCNFENNEANGDIYSKLYNWYAVVDSRNLCPIGWHVPTDAEWTILTDYLGGNTVAGGKMKTTFGWQVPNTGATNESNFSGLPGGRRGSSGAFFNVGSIGNWWSSSESSAENAYYRTLSFENSSANRYFFGMQNGFSVRCLKD